MLTGFETFAIQAGVSAIGGLFGLGQQSAANRQAEKQAAAINKYNNQLWNYNEKNRKDQNAYNKETVRIQRENQAELLDYQDRAALKDWQYNMQIRAQSYENELKGYQLRKQTGLAQLTLNGLASDFAMQDTMRWEREQNIALDFEDKSTMLEFHYAQRGQALNLMKAQVELEGVREGAQLRQQQAYMENVVNPREIAEMEKRQGEVTLQQVNANAQLQEQQTYIEGLKQMGQARAKGLPEKVAAAAIAETGMRVSAIIQEVFNGEQSYALRSAAIEQSLKKGRRDYGLAKKAVAQEIRAGERRFELSNKEVAMRLSQLNDQFYLDKAQLAASRVSLANQAMATRYGIQQQKLQADLNAVASIGFEPSVPPELPKPEALPRPEIQDPFRIRKAPEPVDLSPATVSPFNTFVSNVLPQVASAAVTAFKPTTGNWSGMGNTGGFGTAAANLNTSNITNTAFSLPRLI